VKPEPAARAAKALSGMKCADGSMSWNRSLTPLPPPSGNGL